MYRHVSRYRQTPSKADLIKLGCSTDIPVYLYLSQMLHGFCQTDKVLLINVFSVKSCVYCVNYSVDYFV